MLAKTNEQMCLTKGHKHWIGGKVSLTKYKIEIGNRELDSWGGCVN